MSWLICAMLADWEPCIAKYLVYPAITVNSSSNPRLITYLELRIPSWTCYDTPVLIR